MKSLDIDSLESAEIILAVECAFDVSFAGEELEQCETVGDLFHCLKRLLPCKSIAGKCVTSMAFYRLRRALKAIGVTVPITPETPMHTLSDVSPLKLNRIKFRNDQRTIIYRSYTIRILRHGWYVFWYCSFICWVVW